MSMFVPRYTRSWSLVLSALAIGGCAAHGVGVRRSAPAATGAPATAAVCGNTLAAGQYVVETPSFSLSASTDETRREATASLAASAKAFGVLFGECPPHIGVVVVDTSAVDSSTTVPVPKTDATMVMLLSGGLGGPQGRKASAALAGAVRFTSADAWLTDYSRWWRTAMDDNEIVMSNRAGEAVPRATVLPDWLRVGMLGMLTENVDSRAKGRSAIVDTMSLRTLFDYRLSLRDAVLVDRVLHEMASPAAGALSSDGALTSRDALPREFVREATSVVRYLRSIEGDEAMSYLLAASIGGLDAEDILAHLPQRTSPEALDADWRRWAHGGKSSPLRVGAKP